jgi:hypothetical protein
MSVASTRAADDRSLPMPAPAATRLQFVIGIARAWPAIGAPGVSSSGRFGARPA